MATAILLYLEAADCLYNDRNGDDLEPAVLINNENGTLCLFSRSFETDQILSDQFPNKWT